MKCPNCNKKLRDNTKFCSDYELKTEWCCSECKNSIKQNQKHNIVFEEK